MDEVCRLCLADTTSCDKYTSYDGRIHLLMPEIDLNITPTFTLCEDCSDALNNAYTLKQKCLQIEARINDYISKVQTPLTNLRCVRDQTYNYIKESLNVNIKEEYDKDDNNSITNWPNVEDYKEEYHLTFPKDEIVPQYEDEYASNYHKEEICKESFKSSTKFETSKDLRLTEPIKKHICQVCNKQLASKRSLLHHVLRHTGERPYKCEICGKDFVLQISLNDHMPTHQTSNLEKTFVCKITTCNGRFTTKKLLNQHMRRHLCAKKYQCSLCDKSFPLPSLLRDHMWLHTGEKPFECHICHKHYSRKYVLQQHLKSHDRMKI